MNYVDWAQIISAVATTITTGIAAFTTFLSARQLRYQFEPHLHVATECFQIRMCASSIEDFFWEQPTKEAFYANGGTLDYRFRITNTGAGAAHSVAIFAHFDFESVYNDVFLKLAEHAPNVDILQDEWGAKVSIAGRHIGGFKNPDQAYGSVDYVRPCKDDRVEVPFLIDPSLAFFSLVYGYYLMREQVVRGLGQAEQRIDVTFIIRYADGAGNKMERKQPCQLVISGGRWKRDMNDGVCIVRLLNR